MKTSDVLKNIGRPIGYYPKLANYFGSVTSSILFSHFFYWSDKSSHELGIYKTMKEIEEETGLSEKEIRTARRKLCELGILIETEKRLEHRIYYKLNIEVFDQFIEKKVQESYQDFANAEKESPELPKGHSGTAKRAVDELPKGHSYKEQKITNRLHTEDYIQNNIRARSQSKNNQPKQSKSKHQQALDLLASYGVEEQIAEDYLAIRADKGAKTLTATAMKGIAREAERANKTVPDAITISIERGWVGFNADWVNKTFGKPVQPSIKDIPEHTQGGVISTW